MDGLPAAALRVVPPATSWMVRSDLGPACVRSGAARTDDPTLGALVHDLSQQLPELIRSELRLAQAEMTEKGKRAGLGIGMFSVAGLLAFFGLAALIATAILGLDAGLPAWLSALLVAIVLFAAAGIAALVGKKQVQPGDATHARARHRGRQGRHRRR